MAKRIDGKVISKQIKDELKEEVAQLKAKGIEGSLAVTQVGNDPASSVYVNNKKKAFTSMANNKSLYFNNYCKIISCLRKYFNFKDKKFFILQCFIFHIVIIQNITYNI